VVRLGIVEARLLAVDDLPICFLGQWWRILVEAEDEFHMLMAVGIKLVGFGNVAEVGG
jgi:hypothetical protein